ncbi:MAG: hypothetical protein ACYTFK_01065 [Planctomycetota bacterium]|jgi:ABC-type transport system involved in multi-copper enzyme maturation permease subunit
MFRQLFWKEWRENLWKLCFGGVASAAFAILLFRIRLFPDSANCIAISFVQMLVVPVIYALDIFSGEISNRTIHLLFKFPVPRWKMFLSKYLVSVCGITAIFLTTGLLMEIMSQGRETQAGFLLKMNTSVGVAALLLFTWFCGFGAQSRSEAGSLVAMFSVIIGWGIIFFWSVVCKIEWAKHFVPYNFFTISASMPGKPYDISLLRLILSTGFAAVIILGIACYRFVKVRRYL